MPSDPPSLASDEATHGSGGHVAAVSVPRLHEDVPDTVYPALHVGWHDEPIPRELVQPPTPPFDGGAEASHGGGDGIRYHALGGPPVDDVPSERVYDANHPDAPQNIYDIIVTELVSHPEMSALNADAR